MEINFSVTDVGKMMWLFVDFGDFNQLIPLSYTPIYDDDFDNTKRLDCDAIMVSPLSN